jgi:dihydroorotate dehydrogenase (NAD+) catalytic subunit
LANVGIDRFITEKIPFLEKQKTKVIVNVGGKSIREYVDLCARLADYEAVAMIELNLGCPNVSKGGMEFGANPQLTEQTVRECKQAFSRPLIAKLTPNVTDIVAIAKAAEQGGADAVSLINSLVGTAIDVETWRPRLTFNRGGLTGPAVKPVAVAMVDAVYQHCRLPIIGIGGIRCWQDVVEFMLVGATAVQVGTALFVEPDAPVKIVKGLTAYLRQRRLTRVTELIGKVRKYR